MLPSPYEPKLGREQTVSQRSFQHGSGGASLQLMVSLVQQEHEKVAWDVSGTPLPPVHSNVHKAPFKDTPNKSGI